MKVGLLSLGRPLIYYWNNLTLGAGGYVTGIEIGSDGTKLCRSDAAGPWVMSPGQSIWVPLLNSNKINKGTYGYQGGFGGSWEIRQAPSNLNRFYLSENGYIFRSDDRGATWIHTNFAQDSTFTGSTSANSNYKFCHQKIAIDPNNADILYVWYGDTQGLYVSFNAGASASIVSGVTAPIISGPGGAGIAFDLFGGPNGSSPAPTIVVGGQTRTSVIYVPSWGQGVFQSTDGGQNWSQISDGGTFYTAISITTSGTDRIIVVGAFVNTQTVTGISDTSGLTWNLRVSGTCNGGTSNVYEYWAHAPTAITTIITVTYSAQPANVCSVSAFALSGANTTTPFDSDVSLPGFSTTSTSAVVSTSNANDFLFTFLVATAGPSVDSGYTQLFAGAAPYRMFTEYKVFASTQASIQPGATGVLGGITDAIVSAGGAFGLDASRPQSATISSTKPLKVSSGNCAAWDPAGTSYTNRYWCCEADTTPGPTGRIATWRYNDDGTWLNVAPTGTVGGISSYEVCPDPATPGRVICVSDTTGGIQTLNNGATLVGNAQYSSGSNSPAGTWTVDQSDVGWITKEFNIVRFSFTGGAAFDPTASNKLYISTGVGVNWSNWPSTYVAFRTNVQSLGIENLVNDGGVSTSVPGGYSWFGIEDQGSMRSVDPTAPPADAVAFTFHLLGNLSAGCGCDWASSDPNFVAFAQAQQAAWSGFTTAANAGTLAVTTFLSQPVGADVNTQIAVASTTNMVMTNANGDAWVVGGLTAGVPIYTTNQGTAWANCQHSSGDGGGNLPSTGWATGLLNNQRPCAADRSAVGTYYMRNYSHGLYQSTDGGATWTLLTTSGLSFTRAIDSGGFARIRASPFDYSSKGWTSDLFYGVGINSGDGLWHCTDGGLTWALLGGISNVVGFDFGISRTGTGIPVVGVYGKRTSDNKTGIFICEDYSAGSPVWTLLDDPVYGSNTPGGSIAPYISSVVGDGQVFARFYVNYVIGTVYYTGPTP